MEPPKEQQRTQAEPQRATRWLSEDFARLRDACRDDPERVYDLVVVGSGYGGAMAAAELAGHESGGRPMTVCVLERGREILPGGFPSRFSEAAGQLRFSTSGHPEPRGAREGLFDLRLGEGVSALVANGLGGGSLINAAVMEVPQWHSFDARLPAPVVQDLDAAFFYEVKALLGARATDSGGAACDNTIALHPAVKRKPLPKREALDDLAVAAGGTVRDAALTIEMQGAVLDGVRLNACTLCGDCMTGCNVGARRSLDTNLLVRAKRRGAEIYTGAAVLQVHFMPDGAGPLWQLEVVPTDLRLREKAGEDGLLLLRTRKLILAAGTLGSTEILLRSQKEEGLRFSPQLGERFSTNGDNVAAITHAQRQAGSVAHETEPLQQRHVGPTITGVLPLQPAMGRGFLVQEFAVPAPLRRLFAELVTTGHVLRRLGEADRSEHHPSQAADPLAVDEDAIARTSLVGLIGHDDARGALALPAAYSRSASARAQQAAYEGGLKIRWPGAAADSQVQRAFERFEQAAARCGDVVPNPLWRPLPRSIAAVLSAGALEGTMLTVHPLGGCAMADSWREGVVDSHGAVFDFENEANSPWQGSLIVLDGAILPGSLGANPALTIAALSLRAARHWRRTWGWTEGAANRTVGDRPVYRLPAECTLPADQVQPTEVQIIERLVGPVQLRGEHGPKDYVAELTLGFRPRPLHELNRGGPQVLELVQDADGRAPNRLRLYDKATWDREHLHAQDDDKRIPHALLQARLGGRLELLHREESRWLGRALRGFAAYTLNRGLRDLVQYLLDRARKADGPGRPGLFELAKLAFSLATHAAEVRRFDYKLRIEAIESAPPGRLLGEGEWIHGVKRFTYECGANPWNQLLYLSLERMPGQVEGGDKPRLKLDAAFLAHRGVPLVRITRQQDQPSALADLASFAAYWLRLMLSIHVWSFRTPDPQPLRQPYRLPGELAGLPPPEVHEIALRSTEGPVRVRLTRYRGASPASQPLLLIHGYSASGTTFAHPALKPGMAEHFWRCGRDIWIVDLRSSAGMPTATLPWTFEQVARADIPMAVDLIVREVARERGCAPDAVQVDVFAHCIGAVMLSMALLTKPPQPPAGQPLSAQKEALLRLPGRLRRIVLSQKGFALQYSTANVLRAYVLRYLKPLLPKGYQFRPTPVSPSNQEQLLDRFLGAMPYPPEEFRRENPLLPWKRTPWVATRHRMDALYERTFNVNRVSDEVLACIDDFFGPLSIETVTQTIHFARYRSITNQYGRNIFVTEEALQRWPRGGTMSLHAADNGMVDPSTLALMRKAMNKAGVPFYAAPPLPGGHQDCLIGVDSARTFEAVDQFLSAPDMTAYLADKGQPVPPPLPDIELDVPWMGPRLHRTPTLQQHVRRADGREIAVEGDSVQILIAANPAGAQASAIVVPVVRDGAGFRPLHPPTHGYPATPIVTLRGWLSVERPSLAAFTGPGLGYLVLVHTPYANSAHWQPLDVLKTLAKPIPGDVVAAQIARKGAGYERAYVSLADIECAEQGDYEPLRLRLLLTSCQYPAGILDGMPAQQSLERLAGGCRGADGVLMVGDQIYADATAGLLDPARLDDQYGKSYEAWLRTQPLRRVMRQVPVHMTLDDHEIMDNWGPGAGSLAAGSSVEEAARRKEVALHEFWYYQRGARPSGPNASPWYRVKVNGFEVFMADTRSQRQRDPAQLMDSAQWQALDLWLAARRDEDLRRAALGQPHPQPKFLACGSWLAPRRLGAPGRAEEASRCDGWEAFPAEAAALLRKIAEADVRGVVLLSGDAHVPCWAELGVRPRDGSRAPVRVLCLYAPAMYAPFPFANARRQDFTEREVIALDGTFECEVSSHWPEGGDGFMDVTAELGPDGWTLRAQLEGAAGPGPARHWVLR